MVMRDHFRRTEEVAPVSWAVGERRWAACERGLRWIGRRCLRVCIQEGRGGRGDDALSVGLRFESVGRTRRKRRTKAICV